MTQPFCQVMTIEMTGLRAYTINTLCTIQVYNYLPKNKHVSDVSAYVAREKFNRMQEE